MKKNIITAMMLVIGLAGVVEVAEAKRVGGRSFGASRSVVPAKKTQTNTQKSQTQQQKQADADFNNTPPKSGLGQNANTATNGSGMNGFVTGAMAGYLLSNALSSNEVQAQENQSVQAEENTQNIANEPLQTLAAQTMPSIAQFKAIAPQTDPYLIEQTAGYLRYCLNGVQYLVGAGNTQLAPTLMVDKNNQPVQCQIVP